MSHLRKQIRDRVVEILKAGETLAGVTVYANRPNALWSIPMPILLVYMQQEDSTQLTNGRDELKRIMTLSIEGRVEGASNLDDDLDELAEQVETLIDSSETLGLEQVLRITLTSTEIDVSAEGKKPIGAIRLNYEVTYIY